MESFFFQVKKLAKRQQQQQHSHLEAGLTSPHLIEDGELRHHYVIITSSSDSNHVS